MSLRELIHYLSSCALPGISAHKAMSFTNRNFEKPSKAIPSAVSILLFEANHSIYFPLIKRSNNSVHHKNQIALPGGRLESNETIIQCAIREMYEEIGIPAHQIFPVRTLTELYIPVSNHLVHPIITYTTTVPNFIFSNQEVDKIIICGINDLLHFTKQYSKVKLTADITINAPSFVFKDEVIWGATVLILNEFKEILMRYYST